MTVQVDLNLVLCLKNAPSCSKIALTFSDPFGLCPEKMRDKDGNCPGGLTVKEWNKVEESYAHLSRDVRRRTAARLMKGQIHGGSLSSDEYSETDKLNGTDITINRDFGLFGRSIFNDPVELPKSLIHEDQHVTDLAKRPKYLTPGEAYEAAIDFYETRAKAAEKREYVP